MQDDHDPDQDAEAKRRSHGQRKPASWLEDPEDATDAAMLDMLRRRRAASAEQPRDSRTDRIAKLSLDQFSRLDSRASRLASERIGPQPQYGPIPVGILAYAATSVVPWFGLEAFGVMNPSLDVPIVVTGAVAAVAAGLYQRHRWHRWYAVQHQAFDELLDAERPGLQ